MPVRAYGSRIQLPSDWIQGCSLEPNLGIHEYHQTRTQDKLKGTKWLCFNDELLFADQDGIKNHILLDYRGWKTFRGVCLAFSMNNLS